MSSPWGFVCFSIRLPCARWGAVQTAEYFWRVYDHCARPAQIQSSGQTTFHVFKQGIKPTWEDPANARGGAWIVRLRKGLAARFWEELLLAMVGEQFESGSEVRVFKIITMCPE